MNFSRVLEFQTKILPLQSLFKGYALVAQLVEQMTLNHWARSSSLREGTPA